MVEETNRGVSLAEEYEEIAKIIENYELPEEAKIEEGNFVSYENGYEFFKNFKILASRIHKPKGGPGKPTESQHLGVII